jgi:hypothetical protein
MLSQALRSPAIAIRTHDTQATRRFAATTMAGAALLAIAGFTALGSAFDYPNILKEPTDEIIASYRAHQGAVMSWFLVLVVSAGLLAPIGVALGRIAGGRRGRWIAGLGIAAAVVQVIGLSRWVLLVPHVDADTFETLHTWLGEVLGETIGYVLTAAFTVVVVSSITHWIAPRWMSYVGYASAGLIATGVLIPLIEAFDLANFLGYVLWCLWLIAMAVVLWRSPATSGRTSTTISPPAPWAGSAPR